MVEFTTPTVRMGRVRPVSPRNVFARGAKQHLKAHMNTIFENLHRSTLLETIIREEIRSSGPMTFYRFMQIALYHPDHGYYHAGSARMNRTGDYITSPETHPVFGALLASFARGCARALETQDMVVVEQGAGTGALAEAFVDYWSRAFTDAQLLYVVVEPSARVAEALSDRLGDRVNVVSDIEMLGNWEGLYVSNELPDAFPVHRVRMRNGSLQEVFVGEKDDTLVETEGPLSDSHLQESLEDAGISLPEGAEIEVSPNLEPWQRSIAKGLERGFVLTLDYGYTAEELVRLPRGTLLAHYRHTANEQYYQRIGRQDVTAHVCWDAVESCGRAVGLQPVERISQRDFLTRWGWKEFGRHRMAAGAAHAELDAIDRLGRAPDGMGHFGVLLQATPGLSTRPEAQPLDVDCVTPWRRKIL